jgi:hypothetical protein
MPPGSRAAQEEVEHKPERCGYPHRAVHPGKFAVIKKRAKETSALAYGVGVMVVVDYLSDAARYGHGTQSGDEGRQGAFSDEQPVQEADKKTAGYRDRDRRNRVDSIRHERRRYHAAHSDDRTDGEVYVPRYQDIRLSYADYQDWRNLTQQVVKISRRNEIFTQKAEDDKYQDKAYRHGDNLRHPAYREYPA